MSDENTGANGPINVNKHVDLGTADSSEHSKSDPRAAAMEAARAAAAHVNPAAALPAAAPVDIAPPTGSVIVTELQEIKSQLTIVGTAVLTGVWLAGMLIGLLAYNYYRAKPKTVSNLDTESNGETDGE